MQTQTHDNVVTLPFRGRIECLGCGKQRALGGRDPLAAGECPRCHYLGWAYAADLDEAERRELRDRPPEKRARHRAVGLLAR